MIITRQKYLDMLVAGQGNGLVKIVTGGRRCGKSFLLFQIFHQYLLQHGVDEGHLIEVSLDDRRNRKLCDPDALLDYLDSRIKSDGKTNFIFLDEIQLVDDFIGVLLSLMHTPNTEVYVSGSNSKFLSKDVVTLGNRASPCWSTTNSRIWWGVSTSGSTTTWKRWIRTRRISISGASCSSPTCSRPRTATRKALPGFGTDGFRSR